MSKLFSKLISEASIPDEALEDFPTFGDEEEDVLFDGGEGDDLSVDDMGGEELPTDEPIEDEFGGEEDMEIDEFDIDELEPSIDEAGVETEQIDALLADTIQFMKDIKGIIPEDNEELMSELSRLEAKFVEYFGPEEEEGKGEDMESEGGEEEPEMDTEEGDKEEVTEPVEDEGGEEEEPKSDDEEDEEDLF